MIDVCIIGGGPAGVSVALYTARASLKTTIICKNYGALEKAERVDNYYGYTGVSGKNLVETGLQQARDVGAEVFFDEVVGISLDTNDKKSTITIETTTNTFTARAVILATGANRTTPKIKGTEELEGFGVSYCAICDGYFYRGKDVAVLGSGSYALHEVEDLLSLVKSVTVLTNGTEAISFPKDVNIRTDKISELTSTKTMRGEALSGVRFENGDELQISGLFVAMGIAGGTELARKIGAVIKDGSIHVDKNGRTSVPNLWAVGDCVGGLKQIAKAVSDGAIAGTDIVKSFKN